MNHFKTPAFNKAYSSAAPDIRTKADKQFDRLKENPKHPSLHFKKVGDFWSARIDLNHRALAVKSDDDFIWFWMGNHADYERLIS